MNDRPIYYVRMNDVSVRTGVHILSGTDAGIGLYELCFMFLHFLFAHTLSFAEKQHFHIPYPTRIDKRSTLHWTLIHIHISFRSNTT